MLIAGPRNYAATAADTFSSELGILSKSHPRLIISPTLRVVPPGTNGGVTGTGILAGSFGAFTIGLTSAILLPFCSSLLDTVQDRVIWVVAMTVWGTLGSILDSVLGGLLQASVVDKRSGKIVEGAGGQKVRHHLSYRAMLTSQGPYSSVVNYTRKRKGRPPAFRGHDRCPTPRYRGRGQHRRAQGD